MFYPAVFLPLFLFLAYLIHGYLRLRHVPGPLLASFSKLWLLKWMFRGALHIGLFEACQRYGSVVRVGPNEVVTDDPSIIRRINAVRSRYTRSSWYDSTSFDHSQNHVFCERDEAKHIKSRNQMIPGYSGRDNLFLESSIDKRVMHLVDFIRQRYLSSPAGTAAETGSAGTSAKSVYRPVDFARIAQYFTLDVITDVAFGRPFGFLETDSDVHDYIKTQKALLPFFEWLATLPWLDRLIRIPIISRMVMPKPTDQTGLGYLMGVVEKIVEERYARASKDGPRSDMLESFIRHGVGQEQAKVETVLQVMAGSDTTVTALRMTVLSISTSPSVLTRLLAELNEAEQKGKLSRPIAEEAEILSHLPYLCACVKESLRLRPPVVATGYKVVPSGGDTIHGMFLPQGTLVGYNGWSLHRSPAMYGEDADLYRPSRWTEARDEESRREMAQSIDLVFSYGKNACMGKPVALMELHKVVTELFRRFDFALLDPLKSIHSRNRNGLFVQSDMWMTISPRDAAAL